MRSVFDAYKEISEGKEIEETIESEFSGSMRDAYLALGTYKYNAYCTVLFND